MANAKPIKQSGGELYEFISTDTVPVNNGGNGAGFLVITPNDVANTAQPFNVLPQVNKLNLTAFTATRNLNLTTTIVGGTAPLVIGLPVRLYYPTTGFGTQQVNLRDGVASTTIKTFGPGNWIDVFYDGSNFAACGFGAMP